MFVPISFGDGEEYSIISHWKYNDGYGSVELIRVTIDGVDARIESGADKYHPLVVVVLAKVTCFSTRNTLSW